MRSSKVSAGYRQGKEPAPGVDTKPCDSGQSVRGGRAGRSSEFERPSPEPPSSAEALTRTGHVYPPLLPMLSSRQTRAWLVKLTPTARRTVWTHSTLLGSSPRALLDALQFQSAPRTAPSAQVYTISKNVPYPLIDLLQSALLAGGVPSIGALSELLPKSTIQALAPSLAHTDPDSVYTLAVSHWTPTGKGRAIPWRSSLVGRKGISVGREIASGPRADKRGLGPSDDAFEAFMSGRKWGFGDQARGAEGEIEELAGVR